MEQNASPHPAKTDKTFKISVIICLVVLFGAVGWLAYEVKNPPETKTTQQTKIVQETDYANLDWKNWETTLTSGQGAYSFTVPDGWSPLIKDTQSDRFAMHGMAQPTVKAGREVVVTEVDGYGGDSTILFSISTLATGTAATPMGEVSDFSFGKAEDEVKGKKYMFEYPTDDYSGIGTTRIKGDRDYQFVFPAKNGKELHVYYSVYASDPRNQIDTVDEIVRTIQLK